MVISEPLTIRLEDINTYYKEKIGGKASNLGNLIQNNFNVPEGFVLTTDAYSSFIHENNLYKGINSLLQEVGSSNIEKIEETAKEIQDIILQGIFPENLKKTIKQGCKDISCENFVVRSSAISEDSDNASFAGQYESYLNLKTSDDVIGHVKKCYSSLWSSRALSYRIKNNIPHENMKIAVIVQKMVPAKCAGVLFTVNPTNSKKSEMLIESNFGLGESVMSGLCSPDQFIIDKKCDDNQYNFKIIDKKIGKKEYIVFPDHIEQKRGIKTISSLKDESLRISLSDQEILELSKLGLEIENLYQKPQDIEWAIDENKEISILQTRPITAFIEKQVSKDIIYSRGYSDDYWNDNCTPLFFNLLGDQLTDVVNVELNNIMGYKKMQSKLLKLYNGHVYFNLDVLKRKVENEIPPFMRNEDLLNYFPNGSGPYGKETIKDLPFHIISRIVAELRIMLFDPQGSISKTDDVYYQWTREKFNPFYKDFNKKLENFRNKENLKNLFQLAEELDILMRDHFRLVRYGIPVHNIGMNLLVQYLLTKFIGKQECLKYYPILISGLDHKLTETNQKIHNLASQAQKSKKLTQLLIESNPKNLMEKLLSYQDPEIESFHENLKKFLIKYGDRGFTREPYYPRWREEPRYVVEILQSLVLENEEEISKIQKKNKHHRNLVKKYIESKIRSQFLGFTKWKLFSTILKFSKRYIKFREAQRFNLDKWITLNRNLYLEIAKLLQEKGYIINIQDIFFLYRNEIRFLINREIRKQVKEQLKVKIAERKRIFERYEDKVPPKFISGKREFNDRLEYEEDSHVFKGIPASQGEIRGKIRVLTTIEDISKVKSGEILVVPRTDPGWTPIFSKIGGLITETGGVLSHGAVVSREYGVPAVTNISNACNYFKNGQMVTLNGYNGIVRVK
ncbi:MAG: hypothetical protein BAJALOKI3v1_10115 [Promethearchaeota archaeon]|nr:MAG: hypothetical protein BAJALOKI3v1_10115 [Candidatus Lokiarchaeota archaeon]